MTREEWLLDFHKSFVIKHFEHLDLVVPEKIKLSCGWPVSGGLRTKRRVIGQCFNPQCSADGSHEIFISPWLADRHDVAATVVHEVLHAVVGTEHGHKGPFRSGMKVVGLEGKPTATTLGEDLRDMLTNVFSDYPPYPHATLDLTKEPTVKKQSTRMLKATCPGCLGSDHEYTVRMSRKVADLGMPQCPFCKEFELELDTPDS